jgi:hypothetical protein
MWKTDGPHAITSLYGFYSLSETNVSIFWKGRRENIGLPPIHIQTKWLKCTKGHGGYTHTHLHACARREDEGVCDDGNWLKGVLRKREEWNDSHLKEIFNTKEHENYYKDM